MKLPPASERIYMRLGISSSLSNLTPHEWAEKLSAIGCRSVVFPVDCNADSALIDEYVSEAASHDLLIAEVGIWRNALDSDPAKRKANLDYSVAQLQLADRIGARCAVNVAGALGPRWDGGYKENFSSQAWEMTVSMIQEVIDRAAPKRTVFTIESMPWMIPTGPEEYLKLIKAVNRDRFAVHLDIINMINCPQRYFFSDDFLDHCFELLGDKIVSCHLKDIRLLDEYTFRLEECACGDGTFNISKYISLASSFDADMPMIIEHLGSDEAYFESVAVVLKK